MNKKIFFLICLALAAIATSASPIRDDLAAKGIEYIGQDQIVPIAYLESTGGQFISIPYSASHRTCATIVAAFPDIFTQEHVAHIYGQQGGGYSFYLRLWEVGSTYGRLSYAWRNGWTNSSKTSYLVDDKDHFYTITVYSYLYNGKPRGRCVCDGYLLSDSQYVGEFVVAADDFRVFSTSGLSMRLAAFTISEGDDIIFDLIPVRIGNKGFMLDTVSGELFANQGTGSFILGPDIAPLEY